MKNDPLTPGGLYRLERGLMAYPAGMDGGEFCIPMGEVVLFVGLDTEPQWNGFFSIVLWDEKRWFVRTESLELDYRLVKVSA